MKERRELRRRPNDHHFGSLLMLAVTAGALLMVTLGSRCLSFFKSFAGGTAHSIARRKPRSRGGFFLRLQKRPRQIMSQKPNKAPEPTPTSVRIERHFDVLPGKVWRGWTDPEVVRQWFGSDPAGKVLAVQLDVRPGGNFEVSFMNSDGTEHTCSGVYADVQPETKLSFSWRWKSEPGVETFVSVLLERRGTGTQMYFEHAQVGSASLHDYATGWQSTFGKLERALTAKL